jgi:soluble lytic murein transglycosylase
VKSTHKNRGRNGIGIIVLIILAISIVFGFLFDFVLTKIEYAIYPKPEEYVKYVERYSEEFGVPENIIWAVIKTESGFNASAVSDVGAVGLMQLTESTFIEISNQRLKDGFDPGMRYDPETNIRYGTYYLSYLYARYMDWDTALAAYNGGLGKVDEWLGEANKLSIDDIPYKETKNYVKKVNSARNKYNDLY